jgi:hypothetical protein
MEAIMQKMRGAAMIVPQEWAHSPDASVRRSQAFAFLSIMHPSLSLEERLEMAWDIARQNRPESTSAKEES